MGLIHVNGRRGEDVLLFQMVLLGLLALFLLAAMSVACLDWVAILSRKFRQWITKFTAFLFLAFQSLIVTNAIPTVGLATWRYFESGLSAKAAENVGLTVAIDIITLIQLFCALVVFLVAFMVGTSYDNILKRQHASLTWYYVFLFLAEKVVLGAVALPSAQKLSWVAGYTSPFIFGLMIAFKFKHYYGTESLFDVFQVFSGFVLLTFSLMNALTPWFLYTGDPIVSIVVLAVAPIFGSFVFFYSKSKPKSIQLLTKVNQSNERRLLDQIKYMVHIAMSTNYNHRYYLFHKLTDYLSKHSFEQRPSLGPNPRNWSLGPLVTDASFSTEHVLEVVFCFIECLLKNSEKIPASLKKTLSEYVIYYRLARSVNVVSCLQLIYDTYDMNNTQYAPAKNYWYYQISKKLYKLSEPVGSNRMVHSAHSDIEAMIRYDQLCSTLKADLNESIEICEDLWNSLKEPIPKVRMLTEMIIKLNGKSTRIENLVQKASVTNPYSTFHIQIYTLFAEAILFDKSKKSKAKNYLKNILQHKSQIDRFNQSIVSFDSDPKSFFLVVSSGKLRFGTIEYASLHSNCFIHLGGSDIIQRSLDSLKPGFARGHLKRALGHAMNSNDDSSFQRAFFEPFVDFYLDNHMLLKVTSTSYNLFPSLSNGVKIIVKSSPVSVSEPSTKGMALVDMRSGNFEECSAELSNFLAEIFKERNLSNDMNGLENDQMKNHFCLSINSLKQDLIMDGHVVELELTSKVNEIARQPLNRAVSNAQNFQTNNKVFEVSISTANKNAKDNQPVLRMESSDSELFTSRITVKASLFMKIDQANSNLAMLNFYETSYQEKSETGFPTSQVSLAGLKPERLAKMSKNAFNQTQILDSASEQPRDSKSQNFTLFIVGFVMVLAAKLVLSLVIHKNVEAHINFNDVVIKEALYVNRSTLLCISVFDYLSLVVAEESVKATVSGFEYDTVPMIFMMLEDLQRLKENEIQYTTLINYHFQDTNFQRLLSKDVIAPAYTEIKSLIYFQPIQVFKNDIMPVTIGFNNFSFYFIQTVKYLIQSRNMPTYLTFKAAMDKIFIQIDELTKEFLSVNRLKLNSFEEFTVLLKHIKCALIITFVVLFTLLALYKEWSLHDGVLSLCDVSKVEIKRMTQQLTELQARQTDPLTPKASFVGRKGKKSFANRQADYSLARTMIDDSGPNESFDHKQSFGEAKNPNKQKSNRYEQNGAINMDKYVYRSKMAERQAMLDMKKSLIKPILILAAIIVLDVSILSIMKTASQQISAYSANFMLVNDISSKAHRMRFYTLSFVFDPECAICFPNFKALKNQQLENLQTIKKTFQHNSMSTIGEFIDIYNALSNDFCDYEPLAKSEQTDFQSLCQQSPVLQKGFETLIINMIEQQTSLLGNLSLISQLPFVQKLGLVQTTCTRLLRFLRDEMIRVIEKGFEYSEFCIMMSLISNWLFVLVIGGYLIYGVRRRITEFLWVRAWCVDVLKTPVFGSNQRVQKFVLGAKNLESDLNN
jgi:hypothetical protein